MPIEEIFESEKRDENNLFDIHFYLEGSFWRAYEWSAYLSRNFPSELKDNERLNAIKKVTKKCEEGYVQVGLQLQSFDKYFPNITDNENMFEMKNKHIIIHAKSYFNDIDLSDYESILNEWKYTIKLSDKENKKYKEIKNEYNANPILDSMLKEIIRCPIESNSLIENLQFLSYIRDIAIKITK